MKRTNDGRRRLTASQRKLALAAIVLALMFALSLALDGLRASMGI